MPFRDLFLFDPPFSVRPPIMSATQESIGNDLIAQGRRGARECSVNLVLAVCTLDN
jgi:hypothetical protein